MKVFVKKYILPSLVKANLEQLYHVLADKKMLNVFYHGVTREDSAKIFPRHILKEQFEQHMKYLQKKFNVISLYEAFDMYQQGINPDKKTLTVSFDDGYLNNLNEALPIIEKYKIKTTFFIAGICSEDDSFVMWADIIAFVRYFTQEDHIIVNGKKFIKNGRYGLSMESTGQSIYDYIKKLPYKERDVILEELMRNYNLREKMKSLPREFWKLMNADQIKQMSESEMVTIGSHAQLHYNLANISDADAKAEMQLSKKILTDITQKEIDLISFPDGSYNENVKKTALELGYKGLLAVDYRCESDANDKQILNRWGIASTTSFETIAFTMNQAFIKHAF